MNIEVTPRITPPLDPEFLPASLWNRAFLKAVRASGHGQGLALALKRTSGSVSVFHTQVFPHDGEFAPVNERYVERLLKFLLWQRGGYHVTVAGDSRIADYLRTVYSTDGARSFDFDFMGQRVYGRSMV